MKSHKSGFEVGYRIAISQGMNRTHLLLVLAVFYFLSSVFVTEALAMTAYETSPGVVEVRGGQDLGLVVSKTQIRKVGRRQWVYFCVVERNPSRVRAAFTHSKNEKCFYGEPKLFGHVKEGATFRSIEYGLRSRIYNGRGLIAIGAQHYFYPAYVLYSMN